MATFPSYPSIPSLTGKETLIISSAANNTACQTATYSTTINDILALTGDSVGSLQASYNIGGTITTTAEKNLVITTSGEGTGTFMVVGPSSFSGGTFSVTAAGEGSSLNNIAIGDVTPNSGKFDTLESVSTTTVGGALNVATNVAAEGNISADGTLTIGGASTLAATSLQGTVTIGGLATSNVTCADAVTVNGLFSASNVAITGGTGIDAVVIGDDTPAAGYFTNIANTDGGGNVAPTAGSGIDVGATGGIGTVKYITSRDNSNLYGEFTGTNPATAPTAFAWYAQEPFTFTDSSSVGVTLSGGLLLHAGSGNTVANIDAASSKVAITKEWYQGPWVANRTVDSGGFNTILNNTIVGINDLTPTGTGVKLSVGGKIKIVDGSQTLGYILTCDADGVGTWESPAAGSNNLYTVNGAITDSTRLVDVGTSNLSFNLDPSGIVDVSGGKFKIDNSTTFLIETGAIAAGNILTSDASGNATWAPSAVGSGGIYTGSGSLSGATVISTTTNDLTFTATTGDIIFNNTGATPAFFIEGTSNKIGIGTGVPTSELDVVGSIFVSNAQTIGRDNGVTRNANIQFTDVGPLGNPVIVFRDGGSDLAVIDGSGSVGIGTTSPSTNADLTLEGGALAIKETTTPTADTDYGKIYCKSDNKLYFQDGAGVEHEIAFV